MAMKKQYTIPNGGSGTECDGRANVVRYLGKLISKGKADKYQKRIYRARKANKAARAARRRNRR